MLQYETKISARGLKRQSHRYFFPLILKIIKINYHLTIIFTPFCDQRKQEEKKRKRRERNKQCSREFRRKQKVREQLLIRGKAEKEQMLVERHKRMEKTTKILVKIATSTGACEKGRGIINMVSGLINKENIPSTMVLKNNYCNVAHRRVCSQTKTQGF